MHHRRVLKPLPITNMSIQLNPVWVGLVNSDRLKLVEINQDDDLPFLQFLIFYLMGLLEVCQTRSQIPHGETCIFYHFTERADIFATLNRDSFSCTVFQVGTKEKVHI